MKSEPETFSIEDLRRKKTAGWDGVRNYQARNNLRAMKRGDLALFYYSNAKPARVAGLMEVVGEARPDSTAPPGDTRWSLVDVKFVRAFEEPLTIERIKSLPALRNMVLLKNSRLSVQPVTPEEFKTIVEACR